MVTTVELLLSHLLLSKYSIYELIFNLNFDFPVVILKHTFYFLTLHYLNKMLLFQHVQIILLFCLLLFITVLVVLLINQLMLKFYTYTCLYHIGSFYWSDFIDPVNTMYR